MEQIQQFIKQRFLEQQELRNIDQQSKQTKFRQQYLNHEKNRVQKQNWNIKMLKNIKILSLQIKHNIYIATKRSMDLYVKNNNHSSENINSHNTKKGEEIGQQAQSFIMEHFTQQFINLFVTFYNKNGQKVDPDMLKLIVRPNNNFIVVDLIKSFLQFTRNRFKKVLGQAKLPSQNIKAQILQNSNTCFILPPRFSFKKKIDISNKFLAHTQQSKIQTSCQLFDKEQQFKAQKQIMLYEKCSKFLNLTNFQQIQEKINMAFLSLVRLNDSNKSIISAFKDSCYGKRRNIAYNIFGLYSQQEKSTMIKKLQSDIQQFENLAPLSKQNSSEQFKDRFKKYVQLQQRKQKYLSNNQIEDRIHPCLNIKLQDCPNQIQPLRIMILNSNKELIHIGKFKQNNKLSLYDFLLQKLNRKFEDEGMCKSVSPQRISRNRIHKDLFFDFNKKKVKELLLQDKIMVKKESMLPFLRGSESKQKRIVTQTRQRDVSQRKLGPLKSYQLNNMKKPFLRRANASSQSKISVSCKGDKSRQSPPYNFITRQKHLSTNNI